MALARMPPVQVHVTGEDAPRAIESFEDARLDPRLAANIQRCKYRCRFRFSRIPSGIPLLLLSFTAKEA